ncbi:MAG TPA: Fis family transcriptional regulator, partial [Cyanobacteria bacterium UBA11166]|nr:Fis family transcriptional regulator [Cyanobacteria bacterium UBA11166]
LGEGNALGNLGNAYYSVEDYTKAIEYQQQSLAMAREIKDRLGEEISLGSLGIAYDALGDYTKAIEYHQQRLAIAREIKDRLGEGNALGNLGNAYYSLGDYTKAIEYHQQRLAIAREIKNKLGEGISLNNLGLALFKSGNLTAANETLMKGIEVYESIRRKLGSNDTNKVSIFEQQARTYRTLQQVLIAQNKPDNALEISERGRARAFVELLASRLSSNPIESVTIAPPTIKQLKQTAKEQNATLVEYSIIYDEFKIENKQEWKESELYIWAIQPTGEVTFRKSDLKPLWQAQKTSLFQLVGDTRDSIGVQRGLGVVPRVTVANPTKKLQQLYQILIKPIADILPTQPNAHVIFIPQKSLFLVPFPALKDEAGNYLIDKYTILTAPSIQVLELTHQAAIKNKQLLTGNPLIVGNPTMPKVAPYPGEAPQQLSPLPNAEAEAKAIASLFKTQALTGNQATETVVVEKMQQAKIVHLATHGLLDDIRGIGSAIALTPSGKDDGLLTAEEILDMKINAQLVVLSACDTGRGKITGDGVVGLSRSLVSAGVSSVIVSIWSVPDAPTADLMTEFYQNWQKQPDMAQALRQAMLTTKAKHPHPIDWAAFTLIGES